MHDKVMQLIKQHRHYSSQVLHAKMHFVVAEDADLTEHMVRIPLDRAPVLSRLPAAAVTVLCGENCFLLSDSTKWPGFVEVVVLSNLDAALAGCYRPGHGDTVTVSRHDQSACNTALALAANLIALINRPGACVLTPQRPRFDKAARIRKLTGRAATAWTSVRLVPGALHDVRQGLRSGDCGTIALHRRKGHPAWLPKQRQSPTAIWLNEHECGPRGPGWYCWKPETTVGSEKAGVKAQRTLVALPGGKFPDLPRLDNVTDADRAAALTQTQMTLMADAKAYPSRALH